MATPQRDRSTSSDGSTQCENNEHRGEDRGRRDRNNDHRDCGRDNNNKYIERAVAINRMPKVAKGGCRFTFTTLVVISDGEGTVGVGCGKAKEVPSAIAKAVEITKESFFHVPMIRRIIPHPVQSEGSTRVAPLHPTSPGTDVIAGGPVRAVLDCADVHDVLSKSLGSSNATSIVHATMDALRQLEQPEAVAARRGLPLKDVTPQPMLRARAEDEADKRAQAEKQEVERAVEGVGA